MQAVGPAEQDGRWIFEYRRCRTCGFTVRAFLRYVPDEGRLAELRRRLQACRLWGVSE